MVAMVAVVSTSAMLAMMTLMAFLLFLKRIQIARWQQQAIAQQWVALLLAVARGVRLTPNLKAKSITLDEMSLHQTMPPLLLLPWLLH
jgi:hypothetical protein